MQDLYFLGLSQQQWAFINSFADWLSAVGTVAAVIISLYWASHANRPKAKLSAGVRLMVTRGEKEKPEYVVVKIVNTGDRPIRITGLGWSQGLINRRHCIQLADGSPFNSPLPIDLTHGQEAQWFVPTDFKDDGWFKYFSRILILPHWRIALATLRVHAYTSVGHSFKAKPESTLLNPLKDACRALRVEG